MEVIEFYNIAIGQEKFVCEDFLFFEKGRKFCSYFYFLFFFSRKVISLFQKLIFIKFEVFRFGNAENYNIAIGQRNL